MGCSPWSRKELDMTERLHFHFSLSCIGEGNGNPLQCSCLENPRDKGAWCRGRDAGSVLALTAHTLLCGGPLTCTADASRPAEDWWLVERLRGLPGGLPSMGKRRVGHD